LFWLIASFAHADDNESLPPALEVKTVTAITDWLPALNPTESKLPLLMIDTLTVENDQSVQKTERVGIFAYRPQSPGYVVHGKVRYRDVEGTAYLEMWSVMPNGDRYFSRTVADFGPMRNIQGTSDWREFELPFNLMGTKPESVTLEINVVMPGKGTIEVSELTLSHLPTSVGWFDNRTSGWIGSVMGCVVACFGALGGILAGFLMPRGKGRRLITGMFVFGIVVGAILLVVGMTALLSGQPYHVWYSFLLPGGIMIAVFSLVLPGIRKRYEQVELSKMQALDM
jgi:hypothetical protein